MTKFRTAILVTLVAAAAGCATNDSLDKQNRSYGSASDTINELQGSSTANPFLNRSKLERVDGFYMSQKPREKQDHPWLREIPYSSSHVSSITGRELLESFSRAGINITSAVPLANYSYSGYRVQRTNALNALRIMLWGMGLDFQVDDKEKLVTILPMSTKSFDLNVPHRVSAFSVGDELETSSGSSESSGGSGDEDSDGLPELIQGNGLAASNDFWGSLDKEIRSRCKQMMPKEAELLFDSKAMSGKSSAGSSSDDSDSMYTQEAMCRVTINPNTGTVSLQAPHWLMSDFDEYFRKLNSEINASLVFEGRLILVSSTEEESRGLDLRSFVEFASKEYGVYLSNNALGGVSFTPTAALPGDAIAGPMLGVVDSDDLHRVFNGYLSSLGQVSIVQRPLIRTVSGVSGEFIRASEVYYTTVDQSAVASEAGAQVATRNELQSKETGTFFRIFPAYDSGSGLIRSQMSLQHKLQTGSAKQTYYISSNNGTQSVSVDIPVISTIDYSGELIMNDGETIIVGGQIENSGRYSDEGIMKLKDSFLGGLFGSSRDSDVVMTYYIVLTAKVVKHDRRG